MKIFFKIFTRIHIFLYRLTGGALGSNMRGMPVLLLTTRGRKTGRIWTTPVMYLEDSGSYVLSASNNGQNRHPAWFLNLEANPQVQVEIKGGQFQAAAAQVQEREYQELWENLVGQAPFFDGYKNGRSLPIPLVRLNPIH
jgi:deazaflavin-dependent oxidoreductase (nitroreductase family)